MSRRRRAGTSATTVATLLAGLAATVVLLLAGCEPPSCEEGATDPECTATTALAIGTICADTNTEPACVDDQGFATLEGAGTTPVELVVHMGPQGGFHVYLSARVWGLDPGEALTPKGDEGNPVITFTVWDGDVVLGSRVLQVWLVEGPEGSFERVGVAVILEEDIVQTPNNIDGRPLRVEIEVVDAAGRRVAGEMSVVAVGIIG